MKEHLKKGTGVKTVIYLSWVIALGLLSGCWGSGHAKDEAAKQAAFREVMGFDPPVTVSDIRSSYYYMRDNYIRWLRFKCDDETLEAIRMSKGFRVAVDRNARWMPGAPDRDQNPNAPEWWWELETKNRFQEFDREVSKEHGSDIAHIWIDPETKTVFATRDVID